MPIPHPIQWTPASIARFWNTYESTPGMDLWHFSLQRGKSLLRHVLSRTPLTEPVLDLGCGSGHLLKLLLSKNLACHAADVGAKGIELVASRFRTNPRFRDARLMESPDRIPFDDASMGTIFLLETVEHLLPETIARLFSEIKRVLVPGGKLVITTPWCEDLEANSITCASCGCRFHKTQHLRSCDEAGITGMVARAGLSVIECSAALLLPSLPIWLRAQTTPARMSIACPECGTLGASPNGNTLRRAKSLLHELNHLVCIAEKRA